MLTFFDKIFTEIIRIGTINWSYKISLIKMDTSILWASFSNPGDCYHNLTVIALGIEATKIRFGVLVSSSYDIRFQTLRIIPSRLHQNFNSLVSHLRAIIKSTVEVGILRINCTSFMFHKLSITWTNSSIIKDAPSRLWSTSFTEIMAVIRVLTCLHPSTSHIFSSSKTLKEVVVNSIPSRIFQKVESETWKSLVFNHTGSHNLIEEKSSFKMCSYRSFASVILNRDMSQGRTAIKLFAIFQDIGCVESKSTDSHGINIFRINLVHFSLISVFINIMVIESIWKSHNME